MTETIIGKEKLSPRVQSVKALPNWELLLCFTNGEKRCFDAKPLLQYPAFRPLKDKRFFETVQVAYGTICWEGDIDYCPDTLYQQSSPL